MSTQPRRPRAARSVAFLAVVLAMVAGACSDNTSTSAPPATSTTTTAATTADVSSTSGPAGPATDLAGVSLAQREVATVDSPTSFTPRAGTTTVYVTEKVGRLRSLRPDGTGLALDAAPVLDISGTVGSDGLEQGLLGAAFSPDGATLVVSYTNRDGDSRVDAYQMSNGGSGDEVDRATRRELLAIAQPFDNHNGGNVVFGPDGYLYLGYGDGGSQGDPSGNGQNTKVLLAKILRVEVLASPGTAKVAYSIPPDNPFADGSAGRPEVWLYGVRNPWRFSFDRLTGDLWIGDVGGNDREEIDRLPATDGRDAGRGLNLGWQLREGFKDTDRTGDRSQLTDPITDEPHEHGVCSITGGYVYRGSAISKLEGVYVWSDFCDSKLRGMTVDGNGTPTIRRFDDVAGDQITSFGQDGAGELYVLSLGGSISRIEAA